MAWKYASRKFQLAALGCVSALILSVLGAVPAAEGLQAILWTVIAYLAVEGIIDAISAFVCRPTGEAWMKAIVDRLMKRAKQRPCASVKEEGA